MHTSYFFEKEELKAFITTIADFEANPPAGLVLKGFVLTPGTDPRFPASYLSPLFSADAGNPVAGNNETIIVNTQRPPKICPYPPGY